MPLYPLVQPAVLVETFELGTHISTYVARGAGAPHNRELARLGAVSGGGAAWERLAGGARVDAWRAAAARTRQLAAPPPSIAGPARAANACCAASPAAQRTMLHMMIVDNLIHADLHPGNILGTPGRLAVHA